MEAALIELISQQVLVTNAETKSQLNELKNDIKACRFMLNQILISVQNNPQSLVQTSVAAPSITYNDNNFESVDLLSAPTAFTSEINLQQPSEVQNNNQVNQNESSNNSFANVTRLVNLFIQHRMRRDPIDTIKSERNIVSAVFVKLLCEQFVTSHRVSVTTARQIVPQVILSILGESRQHQINFTEVDTERFERLVGVRFHTIPLKWRQLNVGKSYNNYSLIDRPSISLSTRAISEMRQQSQEQERENTMSSQTSISVDTNDDSDMDILDVGSSTTTNNDTFKTSPVQVQIDLPETSRVNKKRKKNVNSVQHEVMNSSS